MVLFFESTVVSPPYLIYMGADKHENEELIRWGWPEDVWFHVDKLSSAHVYLRLRKGETLDDVPSSVLQDCSQLVKANSIQGNKMNNLDIVYTPWANLKKTADMVVGQVGFHKQSEVRITSVEKRINEIVNRLNKTKKEQFPNLREEKEQRDKEEREGVKRALQQQRQREKEEEKRRQEEAELRSYDRLMKEDKMSTNKDAEWDEDDFM